LGRQYGWARAHRRGLSGLPPRLRTGQASCPTRAGGRITMARTKSVKARAQEVIGTAGYAALRAAGLTVVSLDSVIQVMDECNFVVTENIKPRVEVELPVGIGK